MIICKKYSNLEKKKLNAFPLPFFIRLDKTETFRLIVKLNLNINYIYCKQHKK